MHPKDIIPSRKHSWALADAKSFCDIDFVSLQKTHELFLAPWGGADRGLTKQQFCEVVKKTVCSQMTDEEIELLYSKINAGSLKKICWSDFIDCVFQKIVERDNFDQLLQISSLFENYLKLVHTRHLDPIVAICFVPRLKNTSTIIDYTRGKYYMLGKEGVISMWTMGINLLGYHCIGDYYRTTTQVSYVDMKTLYPSSLVAIISTERNVTFWDVGSKGMERKYYIPLSNCPTCLEYWTDLNSRSRSLLFWGDTAGDVHCLEFNVNRKGSIFIKSETKEYLEKVHYRDLLRGKVSDVRLYKMANIMKGWVKQVLYLPAWGTFIACSECNNQPVCYSEFRGRKKRSYYSCRKGVTSIDVSRRLTILVTGCLDATVRLWNLFLMDSSIGILRGHLRSIVAVAVRDSTEHVISLDKGHTLNVYHILTHECVQRLSGLSTSLMGPNPASSYFYNVGCNEFLMAHTSIAKTVPKPSYAEQIAVQSHDFPLTGVVYSSEFRKIVSVCRGGIIKVWDIYTGTETFQFHHFSPRTPHKDVVYEPEHHKLEITALAMDQTEKRVVTGAADGTLNLWNFSSGLLLNHYSLPEAVSVTAIVMDKVYLRNWLAQEGVRPQHRGRGSNEHFQSLRHVHKEDILCMIFIPQNMLVTASYDGDIIVVARETGNTILRINACQSRYPIVKDIHGILTTPTDQVEQYSCEEEDESCADVFDVLTGRYVTREESDAQTQTFENSVDAMLFLHTRHPNDERTATLITACNEGWIRAWSLHTKGGLLGQFAATERVGEMVLAMTTDPENEFLITGDTLGYVKVWDLLLYCNREAESISDEELKERDDVFWKKFFYFRSTVLKDEAANGNYSPHKRPPPLTSQPKSTLKIPRLLNVFRADREAITCITYVASSELIITGSTGKMVRLWLLSGRYIGTCGDPWPDLIGPRRVNVALRSLPVDLRRCASARTFRVTNTGSRSRLWQTAISLIKENLRRFRQDPQKTPAVADKEYYSVEQAQRIEEERETHEASVELEAVKGQISDIFVSPTWQDPKKSNILGSTFRPYLHHRSGPKYSHVDMNKYLTQCPAYHMMAMHDLDDNVKGPTPRPGQLLDHRKVPGKNAKSTPSLKQSSRRTVNERWKISHSVALNKTNNAKLPPIRTAEDRVAPLMSDKVFTGLDTQNGPESLIHLPSADNSISHRKHRKLSSRRQTRCELL
ncbi:WD repeat-containing protein on Y chromosome-like [Pomacea canaliculata]|uniref:WD repeat-containing protein on Y chromosome-like n=1 Tax=Pomacea canaliculata TaxID=400727 RepID=UPI000D72E274|nr:WD repeat-containing protein on Y chromosome-like [Pomacea canaliculata]